MTPLIAKFLTLLLMFWPQYVAVPFTPTLSVVSFTRVQSPNNTSCAASTTCTVTLTSSINAGDIVAIWGQQNSASGVLTATNNGATFTQCVSCTQYDTSGSFGQLSAIYTTNASAQATSIIVTFSKSSAAQVWVAEYSCSPSCSTAGLSGANAEEIISTTNPTSPSFTSNSGNNISWQVARCSASVSAVSTGFTIGGTTFYRSAYLTTPASSWTAPTWTATTPTCHLGQMEFGASPPAFSNLKIVDFSGSTSGTTLTAPLVQASTFGWKAAAPTFTGTAADLTFQSSCYAPLLTTTGYLNDGTQYTPGSSTLGLLYSTANNSTYMQVGGSNGQLGANGSLTAGFWWADGMVATGTLDEFYLGGYQDNDYNILHRTTTGVMHLEAFGGNSSGSVTAHQTAVTGGSCTATTCTLTVTTGTNYPVNSQINVQNNATTAFNCNFCIVTANSSTSVTYQSTTGTNSSIFIPSSGNTWTSGGLPTVAQWYWVQVYYNGTGSGNHTLAFYTSCSGSGGTGCVQSGSTLTVAAQTGAYPSDVFQIGDANSGTITTGYGVCFSGLLVSADVTNPLWP